MNQRVNGDEYLEKPVRNPTYEIGRNHGQDDSCHFSMRPLLHLGSVFAADVIQTNENENVKRRDHRNRKQKAKNKRVIGKYDFGRYWKYGRKIDDTSWQAEEIKARN